MPTLDPDYRAHSKLPDIFRTIKGVNLDIGPFDRLRDYNDTESGVAWGRPEKGVTGQGTFPRIILRDALGHELDTFTTLQEAIYRAKWNVKQSGLSREPLEWRLPKAPLPARPDLTRTFPPLKHPPAHPPDSKLKNRFESSRVLEFDVEDVGFVRESLQYLPYAPSLSFLRQEFLVGPKTYFQIVGTLLLHKRILSQTEKRNAVYNFPGFCSGCMRMGLCYGCERSTEIHFHEDKPVKTGGGFTYFKKDRPENEIRSKNPINWKIQHPDKALKKLMEEFSGVALEGPLPQEIKDHLDKHGGHRERVVSHIPDFAREMQDMNNRDARQNVDDDLSDLHDSNGYDGDTENNLTREGEGHGADEGHDLDPNDVKVQIHGEDDTDEGDGSDGKGQHRYRDGRRKEHPSHLAVPGSGATNWSKSQSGQLDDPLKSGYATSDDESYRDGSYDRRSHRLPKFKRVESGSDEENDEDDERNNGLGSPRRSRRKEKLYTAPPPFKLKKSPKRSIVSKSPFSTERSYDLPNGKAFEVKKSDRPLTKFKDFRNVDASWKEPKKFELKKGDQKTTKFWSGPPKKTEKEKEKKKKSERSHSIRRVPSPRSVSPDSGLDSEQLTAKRERLRAKQSTAEDNVGDSEPVAKGDTKHMNRVMKSVGEEDSDNMNEDMGNTTDGTQGNVKRGMQHKRKKLKLPQINQEKYNESSSKQSDSKNSDWMLNKDKSEIDKKMKQLSYPEDLKDVVELLDDMKALENSTDVDSDALPMNDGDRKRKRLEIYGILEKKIDDKKLDPGANAMNVNNNEHLQPLLNNNHRKKSRSKSKSLNSENDIFPSVGSKERSKKGHSSALKPYTSSLTSEDEGDLANSLSRTSTNLSSSQRKRSQMGPISLNRSNSITQLDNISSYSSNHSTLDGFHDTAAEYYKDFDLEKYKRKREEETPDMDSLGNNLPRIVPPLLDRNEAHFSVNVLNTQTGVKQPSRRFSGQGGLSSRPLLRSSTFMPLMPGSPKLKEQRSNSSKDPSVDIKEVNQDGQQDAVSTAPKHVGNPQTEQRFKKYQPRSLAISPILYEGEQPNIHTDYSNANEDDDWNNVTDEIKKLYEGQITMSDLESDTSTQHRNLYHRNKYAAGNIQPRKHQNTKQIHTSSNVSTRNLTFHPTVSDSGIKSSYDTKQQDYINGEDVHLNEFKNRNDAADKKHALATNKSLATPIDIRDDLGQQETVNNDGEMLNGQVDNQAGRTRKRLKEQMHYGIPLKRSQSNMSLKSKQDTINNDGEMTEGQVDRQACTTEKPLKEQIHSGFPLKRSKSNMSLKSKQDTINNDGEMTEGQVDRQACTTEKPLKEQIHSCFPLKRSKSNMSLKSKQDTINNDGEMTKGQVDRQACTTGKPLKEQIHSGFPLKRSQSLKSDIHSNKKTQGIYKNRSKSVLKEYQKMYQQNQFRKSSSLPYVGLDAATDRDSQRSLSLGQFSPYFGSPETYDRHARGSIGKSRNSLSRESKSPEKAPRKVSVVENTDNSWHGIRSGQVTHKVPTGRKESVHSNAHLLSSSRCVDHDFLNSSTDDDEIIKSMGDQEENKSRRLPHQKGKSTLERLNAFMSPPLVPYAIDNEKGSLTSHEPDLDLTFDEVIDVENLDVNEEVNDLNEDEERQKKLERKRRHKHRKHRKRRKEQLKLIEDTRGAKTRTHESDDDASVQDGVEKSTNRHIKVEDGEVINHSAEKSDDDDKDDAIECGVESDDDPVDIVARENITDDQPEKVTENKRGRRRKKKINGSIDDMAKRKEIGRRKTKSEQIQINKRHASIKEDRDESLDSKYAIVDSHTEDEDSEDFDVVKSLDINQNKNRKGQRDMDTTVAAADVVGEKYADVQTNDIDLNILKERIDQANPDKHDKKKSRTTKGHSKKPKDGNIKRKPRGKRSKGTKVTSLTRAAEVSSEEEIDLDKLPSVKSQLAKIFENQKVITEDKDSEHEPSDQESCHSDQKNDAQVEYLSEDVGTDVDERVIHKRPKSSEVNHFYSISGTNLKMFRFRSMSMPMLTDIDTLQENMGHLTLEQLKEPFKVPIYLPAFSKSKVILKKQFKTNRKRVKGRERSMSLSVLTPQLFDLGIPDATNKSELDPVREETLTVTPDMSLSERAGTPLQLRVHSPITDKEPPPPPVSAPKKREIVKKVKKPKSPAPPPTPPPPKPPTPVREKTKTPSPEPVEEKPPSREISFDIVKEKPIPELPPIEIPDLPEYQERQSEYKEKKKKERKLIEVTPEIPEAKKKLPPPPKLAPRIKTRSTRKSKVAEAPVTTQELQQLADPLDFLAKYCIINPDRLPYYERVFNGAVNIQTPRYTRDSMGTPGGLVHLPPAQLSQHELNMLRDMTVITHAQTPRREGISVPEQYLEKLNYTIDFVKGKQEVIMDHMHGLQGEKIHLMAELAKQLDRDIVRVDYKTKSKKKKKDDDDETSPKKKKKKKTDETDYDTMGAMSVPKNFRPQRASDITDEVIVSRMDDKMMKKVKKDPAVKNFNMLINRDIEKLKNFDQRIAQIEDEKDLVGLYCMDNYFNEQTGSAPPYEFRRQQSRLYQKLHPDPDIEMNMDEVETALQQINNKLLSEREFQYIYFILDLPKREKINFRLFSIVAALSEKVTQMDPVIRKLINKVDYNALDIKMDKSKELFELIQDESVLPLGNAPADTLAVELTAGGLTPEHTSYVLSKFNREGRGFVDFLDFVTYIPLFIDIHKRIIEDPFNDLQDV